MNADKRVLVAVDFSPCSAAAFRRARRLAAWLDASLVALHVIVPATAPTAGPIGRLKLVPPSEEDLASRARAKWHEFAQTCGGTDGAILEIEFGNPRDTIMQTVRRTKPEMLVIGAHGSSDAARGIGTTAAACAQWAPTQVLVVREGQAGPFRTVVACVDFTDTSRLALEQAVNIATEDCATLHILHVYGDPWHGIGPTDDIRRNMPDFDDRYRQAIEDRVRKFCEPLSHELNVLKPQYHAVEAERHAEGIMNFMTGHGCDLAVLGTRGKFSMREYFWGSTAERVVRESPCSVLAVKPPGYVEGESYQPFADAQAVVSPS